VEMTIPAAFRAVAESGPGLESRVRHACRDVFHERRLLARVVDDIDRTLTIEGAPRGDLDAQVDVDMALPGGIWDDEQGEVAGGVNYEDDADR
jgi:CRISPR-associated protein Cas1